MTLKHTHRGFYEFSDYGHKCPTSTMIMVTTNNFWRNFDSFKEKEHFASTKSDQFRPFKANLSNVQERISQILNKTRLISIVSKPIKL